MLSQSKSFNRFKSVRGRLPAHARIPKKTAYRRQVFKESRHASRPDVVILKLFGNFGKGTGVNLRGNFFMIRSGSASVFAQSATADSDCDTDTDSERFRLLFYFRSSSG
jgi:hypothetical protein